MDSSLYMHHKWIESQQYVALHACIFAYFQHVYV